MSLVAALLEVPRSSQQWARWSQNNRFCCDEINAAILKQYNINLIQYQLDPIPFNNFVQFLENNQAAHTAFNGVLGLQGSDLESVDIRNPAQLEAWVNLVYQELYSARAKLRI